MDKKFDLKVLFEDAEKKYGSFETDWKDVERLYESKDSVIEAFTEELLESLHKSFESDDLTVSQRIVATLGLVPDDPGYELQRADNELKIDFLKGKEHQNVISSLEFKTETIGGRGLYESRFEVEVANFTCVPKRFKIELRKELRAIRQRQAERRQKIKEGKNVRYEILYKSGNTILKATEGSYRIGNKHRFESKPDMLLEYFCANPNRTIELSELRKNSIGYKPGATVEIRNTLQSLGFKGTLLKLFFNKNKNSVFFRNPITTLYLKEAAINVGALHRQISSLKKL